MEDGKHLVTLHALDGGPRADAARGEIASALGGGAVGPIEDGQTLEVEVSAPSREDALRVVRDALAAAGIDYLFEVEES